MRRPQNFVKSPPYFCLYYIQSTVKSKVEISQNFVAFSEYMNFKNFVSFQPSGKTGLIWAVLKISVILLKYVQILLLRAFFMFMKQNKYKIRDLCRYFRVRTKN